MQLQPELEERYDPIEAGHKRAHLGNARHVECHDNRSSIRSGMLWGWVIRLPCCCELALYCFAELSADTTVEYSAERDQSQQDAQPHSPQQADPGHNQQDIDRPCELPVAQTAEYGNPTPRAEQRPRHIGQSQKINAAGIRSRLANEFNQT